MAPPTELAAAPLVDESSEVELVVESELFLLQASWLKTKNARTETIFTVFKVILHVDLDTNSFLWLETSIHRNSKYKKV